MIEAAKAVAVKKGADAVTKAGTKPAQRVAAPKAAATSTTTQTTSMVGRRRRRCARSASLLSCRPRLPAAGPGVPDLFRCVKEATMSIVVAALARCFKLTG